MKSLFSFFTSTRLFFLSLFLVGSCFVFLVPPFQVMDEPTHFIKSYAVSSGQFLCQKNAEGKYGFRVPQEVKNGESIIGTRHLPYHPEAGVFPHALSDTSLSSSLVFAEHPFCETPFWSSLPQAMGIGIARVMDLSLLQTFYIGRLFNLLVAVLLLSMAFSFLPFGRVGLVFVSFLPMTLQQLSSLSLDAVHYSLLILFFSLLLFFSQQKKPLSGKVLFCLSVFSLFAVHAKLGYLASVFLIFLLKKEHFSKPQLRIWFCTGFVLLHFGLFVALRALFTIGDVQAISAGRMGQLSFLLTHPFSFFTLLIHTLNTFYIHYVKGVLGMFGWQDAPLFGIHYLLLFLLGGLLFCSREKVSLSWKDRSLLLGVGLLMVVSVFVIFFAMSTPSGSSVILLVQGKYFLPAFLCFFFAFFGLSFSQRTLRILLGFGIMLSFAFSLTTLYQRYYNLEFTDPLPLASATMERSLTLPVDYYQRFTVDRSRLSGIGIAVSPSFMGTQDRLRYAIRDERCVKILRQGDIAPEILVPNTVVEVYFSPIQENAQSYCFHIFSPTQVQTRALVLSTGFLEGLPLLSKGGKETLSETLFLRLIYKK